jgi:hypothetical protein
MIKERAADQLALRQREDQLAGRDTPPTGLDRPRAPLPTKFTIDFYDQPETRLKIADHRQAAVAGQRRIVRPHHDPSAAPGIVHPYAPPG